MKILPPPTTRKTNPIQTQFSISASIREHTPGHGSRACPFRPNRLSSPEPRVTSDEPRFYKTNPILKMRKQSETYTCKELMKKLPPKTDEKTKPICKNEKMNIIPCSQMTYAKKTPQSFLQTHICMHPSQHQCWPRNPFVRNSFFYIISPLRAVLIPSNLYHPLTTFFIGKTPGQKNFIGIE